MASLPTLAEIKAALGIPADDSSQDAAIERTQAATIAIIEGYLGRGVAYSQEVQTFDPVTSRDAWLFLYRFPVESVTSVTIDERAIEPGAWRVYKNSGQLQQRSGQRWHPYVCGLASDTMIEVSYAGGFTDDNWPAALVDAINGFMVWKWNAAGAGNAAEGAMAGPIKSSTVDGLSITYGDVAGASANALKDTPIPAGLEPWAAQLEPFRVRRASGI